MSKAAEANLWRYQDLLDRGIVRNRTTLRRWICEQGFPRPIHLGPNSIAWRVADVEEFLRVRAEKTA